MAREKEEVRDSCQNSIECGRARADRSARRNHAGGVALNCCFVARRVCRSVKLGGEVEATARKLIWILRFCRGRALSGER